MVHYLFWTTSTSLKEAKLWIFWTRFSHLGCINDCQINSLDLGQKISEDDCQDETKKKQTFTKSIVYTESFPAKGWQVDILRPER